MDNERNDSLIPENDNWLDEILGTSTPKEEIGPDEQAVFSAGLTHPDDLELEKILSEDWLSEDEPQHTAEEETQMFQAPEEEVPETPVQEVQAEETPAPAPRKAKAKEPVVRKGRPVAKKAYALLGIPHILATVLWLFIIVAAGVTLGRTLWVCCADLMAFGKPSQQITITITTTDTIDTVSEKLGNAGLVNYPNLFKFFAEITGKDENISAGTFTLNSHLDYNAMINAMGSHTAAREVVEIMFPEGYNCAQIFRLLADKNVCTVAELEAYAASGELDDYWFLEGVPRGSKYCLEGYMAPDTYEFYTNDDPRRVIEKFLDEFDDRFTDIMKEDFAAMQQRYADKLASFGYGSDYIESNRLTLHRLLTIASLVQKETANDAESYDIASVFYNRLAHPDHPYLGSDATVYYAIGDYFGEKEELTASDLAVDSPYNTRNHQGLPPGPICNPGAYTLYAVLDPNDTNYYYFVYSPSDGVHLFSRTYDEHVNKVNSLG